MKKVWTEVGTQKKKLEHLSLCEASITKNLNSFFLIPKLVIVFKAYYVHKYRIMNTCICKNISVNNDVMYKILISITVGLLANYVITFLT